MASASDHAAILSRFERFGVHLGLERIRQLLAALGNPQQQVPIIHVAGTNGKGSVCAYLSAVLTQAGYHVGRYTSPHLVDWCERICLNEQPITPEALHQLLLQIQAVITSPHQPSPTQFEVITAAAWLYFAQQQVDIAIMEVGLGGRLDATNVCEHPLVSVITPISREHWQRLGPTLADIAREKAGILKPRSPAVIGPQPLEAKQVVVRRAEALDCPVIWPQPAVNLEPGWAEYQWETHNRKARLRYPLPLLGKHQLINSALAIAALQRLQQQGWTIPETAIIQGLAKTQWPGRLQWITWQEHTLLIDGAHNPAAAQALGQFVEPWEATTWIMGMLATKDHADIFKALLRDGDHLHLVPVPDHLSAQPDELAAVATEICPDLAACHTYPNVLTGLTAATDPGTETKPQTKTTVLCGSLYLIGYCFKHFGMTALA
ncbi:MAG: bifunctional folylpolyglutamate synthase/dihydrofolate synthase [Cyanothece sp. SIO1E1]|nr:bifunctional folylpolyglutamate synthase/dihydrofolate synthase [Cyanothece sp. SIO1E1]